MNNQESCHQVVEHVSGNIFLRPNRGNKGTQVGGHTHHFSHCTFLVRGSIHVKFGCPCSPDYREATYHAGDHFLVKAQVKHYIEMLVDDTLFVCIYSHRGPNGEVVQEYAGKHPLESAGSESAYQ